MRRPVRYPLDTLLFPAVLSAPRIEIHPFRPAVEALDEHGLVRRHVLEVVELVARGGRDAEGLAFDRVAGRGHVRGGGGEAFVAAVVGGGVGRRCVGW